MIHSQERRKLVYSRSLHSAMNRKKRGRLCKDYWQSLSAKPTANHGIGSSHFLILLHESYNPFVPYHFKRLPREEKAFFLSKNTIKKTFTRF